MAEVNRLTRFLHRNKLLAITVISLSAFVITNHAAQRFYQFTPPMFPVQAVEWLETNPQQGKMFNELNWGAILPCTCGPGS
jgi:hypothetical protein